MNKDLKTLKRKLSLDIEEGKKHTFYILRVQGRIIGQFGVSRGSNVEKLPKYAAPQLNIENSLMREILACTSSLEEVIIQLRDNGIIS